MKELKELGFEYMPTRTEFDLMLAKNISGAVNKWRMSSEYRDLVNQQPKLGDFIPCISGVPVDEPEIRDFKYEHFYEQNGQTETRIDYEFFEACKNQYQKALEQVKFEGGGEFNSDNPYMSGKTYTTYEQAINDGVKLKIK